MKTAADYRIENVEKLTLGEKVVKSFDAFVRQTDEFGRDEFVFAGAYTAPVRTANKNLWLIPNESDTGIME